VQRRGEASIGGGGGAGNGVGQGVVLDGARTDETASQALTFHVRAAAGERAGRHVDDAVPAPLLGATTQVQPAGLLRKRQQLEDVRQAEGVERAFQSHVETPFVWSRSGLV